MMIMMTTMTISPRRQQQQQQHQRCICRLALLGMLLQSTMISLCNGYVLPFGTAAFHQAPRHIAAAAAAADGTTPRRHLSSSAWTINNVASSADAEFSAFADSLEMEDTQAAASTTTTKDSRQRSSSSSAAAFSSSTKRSSAPVETTWQAKLDQLLDPSTNVADRQIVLSELLNSNDKIRDSVLDALTNRKLDPLLTPAQKKLQDGTRAVVRQLANDILPQITQTAATATAREGPPSPLGSSSSSSKTSTTTTTSSSMGPLMPPVSPSDIGSIGSRLFSIVSDQIQRNLEDLQDDLTDPLNKIPQRLSKQTEGVMQEARNIFLETPEGLEEPSYTVVESCDLYEIRDYDGYSVASTVMVGKNLDTASMEGVQAGQAFNVLAAYLFGRNEESKSMSMTTPVTTTSLGEMRFYLAEPAFNIPKPSADDDSVSIVEVPPARLAVRKFTGFVTDGEVARQKDVLLQALAMDGVGLDVPHGAVVPHVIFQYNPPYTLPMVRRNEIAVPVLQNDEEEPATSLKEEWNVVDEEECDDGSVNGLNNLAPSD